MPIRSFREIKRNYRFTSEDEQRLAGLRAIMEEHADTVMSTLSLWIMGTAGTAKFFAEESRRQRVFVAHRQWFLELFSGVYDNRFYEKLIRIGRVHVQFNVDAHYMNRAMNIVKNACIDVLQSTEEAKEEFTNKIISLGKILDMSLDVITTSYIDEELRSFSPVYKVKSALVAFSERFSQFMNLVLILALIGLTCSVVWLFVIDVGKLIHGELEQGIIGALGSLLLLWMIIELINTEISHLKGGKFHISVFIGVALVTTIREIMIATLKHENPEIIYYLVAATLVIGLVYWLVVRVEDKTQQGS